MQISAKPEILYRCVSPRSFRGLELGGGLWYVWATGLQIIPFMDFWINEYLDKLLEILV